MNVKSVTKLEKSQVELEVEVQKEEFEDAISKAFVKRAPSITVPGFRKGKATKKMIEKFYGESVFYEDAVNLSYPKAYDEAVAASDVAPIDKADIEVINIDANGYTFKAKVTVRPEVKLGEYKGIKAEKGSGEVSEEQVDAEISKTIERNARLISVDNRPAQDGDTVLIDYAGSVNGEAFQGGTAEKQTLKLGSGQFIPGFESQIAGKNVGEEFDVSVTFPEEYHANELAGKPAVFKVKLHEIKYTELPEFDDEFVKDVSEFDTVADYKADVRKKLEEVAKEEAEHHFEDALIDQISDNTEVEIPEVLSNRQFEQIAQEFEQRIRAQGLDFQTYLKLTGSTFEDFRKNFSEQAHRRAKIRLVLEQIAINEGLKATKEDIDSELAKLAGQYGLELDKMKTYIPESELSVDIEINKAIDFVKANAVALPKTEEKAEKKESKTAVKKTSAKKAQKEE